VGYYGKVKTYKYTLGYIWLLVYRMIINLMVIDVWQLMFLGILFYEYFEGVR
jgi:hypothetical protein